MHGGDVAQGCKGAVGMAKEEIAVFAQAKAGDADIMAEMALEILDELDAKARDLDIDGGGELLADAGVPRNQAQLREGFAEEEIARFVHEEKIDLLLIGAIARGHLANALIGNTAERVLESVECDLLIFKTATANV
mgnify:CR=1 FL=1